MVSHCSLRSRSLVYSLRQQREISLAKFVLFVVNTTSLVPGLTSLGIGLIFLVLQNTHSALVPYTVKLFGAPLVSMGFLAYGAAVLGYCSVWRHRRGRLVMYSICTVTLIATQGYLMSATHEWGQLGRVRNLTDTWLRMKFEADDSRQAFGLIEVTMDCCGSYGAQSYEELGKAVPASCCKHGSIEEYSCVDNVTFAGCAVSLSEHLQTAAYIANSAFIYIVALEVIGLVACFILYRNAPKKVFEPLYSIVRNKVPEVTMEMLEKVVTFPPQRRTSL